MAALVRLRLTVAYRGTDFHGWATQPGLRTIQGELETALQTLIRQPIALTVAGRTDAGVHARAQVAHCDVPEQLLMKLARNRCLDTALQLLPRRLNALVARNARIPGADIVVREIEPVTAAFDARFSALRRHYEYRIADAGSGFDPLTADTTWWIGGHILDIAAMHEALQHLLGEHDFLSFCKPRPGATTIRTLTTAQLTRHADHISVRLSADAFCHSMVRSMVGAIVEVGRGRRQLSWLCNLLAAPSRTDAAPVAPAHGLTLIGVDYPPPQQWKTQQERTRRVRQPVTENEMPR
ncbi:MAG: tRNA pseudouridine(38-40) synthase TruA [Actinomycetaceae bacterium]|nr:tRNA pseudouridine(38-40) synthase TruA [Actinomycetaceae bacterium]